MNDEVEKYEDGYSLREIVEFVRRRKRAIIHTFAAALVAGFLFTWFSKPVYRCTSQVLVQSNRGSHALDIDLPFKDLIQSSSGRSIDTQKVLIKSKAVVTEACNIAGI